MARPKREQTALVHKAEGYDVADVERPARERWVTMSNALTRAGHGLTLAEKRVVMIAVSKLDSRRPLRPGEAPCTRITAAEYAEVAQCELNTAYEALQAAAKALYKRSITFYEPAFKRNGKPLPPTMVQVRWVGRATYHVGEGWIELAWWHELLPHLTGLQRQFTTYQLQQASALRSVYSWRLLELLQRFKSTGVAEYTIEDFKVSMDAPPSLSDFGQVKRRIIEPAVRELREKDGWLIQWEPIKAGRKVKALRFRFMRDPQGRLL
jgi:plasmid replication initiation protein